MIKDKKGFGVFCTPAVFLSSQLIEKRKTNLVTELIEDKLSQQKSIFDEIEKNININSHRNGNVRVNSTGFFPGGHSPRCSSFWRTDGLGLDIDKD